jgi:hypothetical protein
MQFKHAILAGAMAALASLAVPALARHSDAQKSSNSRLHRPAAPASRRRMEHGHSFRVRNWPSRDKHRANPRPEVQITKPAEKR